MNELINEKIKNTIYADKANKKNTRDKMRKEKLNLIADLADLLRYSDDVKRTDLYYLFKIMRELEDLYTIPNQKLTS